MIIILMLFIIFDQAIIDSRMQGNAGVVHFIFHDEEKCVRYYAVYKAILLTVPSSVQKRAIPTNLLTNKHGPL